MALCDRLEAAQTERESRRDRLAAVSLNPLNQPADAPTAFQDQARFYFNHLPRLTTRPEHIQQLRQTILSIAVHGRLVPQELHDKSVSEMLMRIQADKSRLIKEGKMRRQEPVARLKVTTFHSACLQTGNGHDSVAFFIVRSTGLGLAQMSIRPPASQQSALLI